VAGTHSATDVSRVVSAVPEDALRPTARPTAQSLEWRNESDQKGSQLEAIENTALLDYVSSILP
jgi:hypothetical protein